MPKISYELRDGGVTIRLDPRARRPGPGQFVTTFHPGIHQDQLRVGMVVDLRPDDSGGDRWNADGVLAAVVTGPLRQILPQIANGDVLGFEWEHEAQAHILRKLREVSGDEEVGPGDSVTVATVLTFDRNAISK